MKLPQRRVGRGGKRGTTSGRGTKGQRARAGHRIRPAIRDLIQRIPKLRGIKHGPRTPARAELQVGFFERFGENSLVTPKMLRNARFIPRAADRVKVLGGGKLSKALTLKGIKVSSGARRKIEAAHGKIEP